MKVIKKWGSEEWIINCRNYCFKKLRLKKGYRCSLHYHKKKDETFFIENGKVLMEVGKNKKIMKKGDVVRIKPRVFHRFTGLTKSIIYEVSTHHKDKDSYRKELSGKYEKNNKNKF